MANLFQPSLQPLLNNNGDPVSGGKWYFYLTGTTTPATIYSDQAGTSPMLNPVEADGAGMVDPIYLSADATYRVRRTDSLDVALGNDVDPVRGYDENAAANSAADANVDAIATAADRVQTGLDAVSTAADRVQTGLDVVATAADRAAVESVSVTGFTYLSPVATATTANITLSGEQTIDGVLTSTSRVLVKNQTAPAANGVYVSAAGAWARASGMAAAADVAKKAVFVSGGTTQGAKSYATYSVVTTLGTDAIAFVEVADMGAAQDQIDAVSAAVGRLEYLPAAVKHFYITDQGQGTAIPDLIGSSNIDLTTGTGYSWDDDGFLHLASGYFKLPAMSHKCIIPIMKTPEGGATGYCLASSSGKAIGHAYAPISIIPSFYIMDGWGIVDNPPRRPDSTGAGSYWDAGEAWNMVAPVFSVTDTGTPVIGAANTGGAAPVSNMTLAGLYVLDTAPTLAELRLILNHARAAFTPRGIYLTPYDCPKSGLLTVATGESTDAGVFAISRLGADNKAQRSHVVAIRAKNAESTSTLAIASFGRLSFTGSFANNNAPSTSALSGWETGFRDYWNGANDPTDLHVHFLKLGAGSTYLLPAGDGDTTTSTTYNNAAGGTSSVTVSNSRNTANVPSLGLAGKLVLQNIRKAEQYARSKGIGYRYCHFHASDNLNDAYIGPSAVDVPQATYKGYIDAWGSSFSEWLGIAAPFLSRMKGHNPDGDGDGVADGTLGSSDFPNDATGTARLDALTRFRASEDDWAAASALNNQLDGDDYGLDSVAGDDVHPSEQGNIDIGLAIGALAKAAMAYPVEPLN